MGGGAGGINGGLAGWVRVVGVLTTSLDPDSLWFRWLQREFDNRDRIYLR